MIEELPVLSDILEVSAVAITGSAVVKGIIDAISGLHAKYAARKLISVTADPALQRLAATSSVRDLDEKEMELATSAILRTVQNLPKKDLDHLMHGLKQPSRFRGAALRAGVDLKGPMNR